MDVGDDGSGREVDMAIGRSYASQQPRWWQSAQCDVDGDERVPTQVFQRLERLFERGHRNDLDIAMACVVELLAELVFTFGQFTLRGRHQEHVNIVLADRAGLLRQATNWPDRAVERDCASHGDVPPHLSNRHRSARR